MEAAKCSEIILRTTPAQFVDQAEMVSDKINAVAGALDELEAVILRTSHYWIGEAGDYYRILYEENREEIQEIIKDLSAHPTELLKMAQLAAKTSPGDELSEPLSGDVL